MTHQDNLVYWRKKVIGNCTLYHADCLDLLPHIGRVQAILTSPPYNLAGFHQMHNGNSNKWEYSQYDDDMPEDEYRDWQIKLCNQLYDITDGPLFYSHKNRIVNGEMFSPLYWLRETKWLVHQAVVLNKGSGANVDKRRFFPVHEHIYVCIKDKEYKLDNSGCYTDVWQVEQTNRKEVGHPAVMPLSAAEKCVNSTNADIILDPFMGSGTTGVACAKLGRKFIGIEVDPVYFDLACQRIEETQKQGVLSI